MRREVYFYANGRRTGHTGEVLREEGGTLEVRADSPPGFAGRVFGVPRSEVRSLPDGSRTIDDRGGWLAGLVR